MLINFQTFTTFQFAWRLKTLMSMLELMVLGLKHFVPILLLLQLIIIHFLLLMMNLLLMRYLFQFLEVDEKKLNNVNRGGHRDSKHMKVWANNTFDQ
jgi:sensor histidine kinase YesM